MSSNEARSRLIGKLAHPLIEVRERVLDQLKDELLTQWPKSEEETSKLLHALLASFFRCHWRPSHQLLLLSLLCDTVKSEWGPAVVEKMGAHRLLESVQSYCEDVGEDARNVFHDLLAAVRALNASGPSAAEEETPHVPRLHITSPSGWNGSSEDEGRAEMTCKEPVAAEVMRDESAASASADITPQHHSRSPSPVRLATLPVRALSEAEASALAGAESALARRDPVATARCCRLVRLALLKDFPAEVFLIRSALVQRLATLMGDGGCAMEGSREELLETMEGVTAALRARLRCLSSPQFRRSVRRPTTASHSTEERLNHQTGDVATPEPMSVPSYCLLVLGQLLRVLNESFATPGPDEHAWRYSAQFVGKFLDCMFSQLARELQSGHSPVPTSIDTLLYCQWTRIYSTEVERGVCLLESALQLLLDSVPRELWAREHAAHDHRRLAHTALLVMRALAHLLANLRAQSEKGIRTDSTWTAASEVRVVRAGVRLARWARGAAAAPRALLAALAHHLPPAPLQLLYPDLHLQDCETDLDEETREKLKIARSQCAALESTARFVRGDRTTETLLAALPALELLACEEAVRSAADVLLSVRRELDVARGACVSLMAHKAQWVRAAFYARLEEGTEAALTGDAVADEGSLLVLNDVSVLTEMFSGGLCSSSAQVRRSAERMAARLLGARSHLSECAWWKLAAALLPALPALTCNAAHNTELGERILQTLEPRTWESLGLPEAERLATLVRLLFSSRAAVQADAAHRLCHTLLAISDSDSYLPPRESVRADILLGALRRVEPADFNVDLSAPSEHNRQGTTGLEQMLELLKQDAGGEGGGGGAGGVEPSLRRATLQRLAVVMQQPAMHEHFLQRAGLQLVCQHLRWSLLVNERRTFPDCAESCVSILNGVVCTSTVAAYELADTPDLLLLLIRGVLVFPTHASLVRLSAQLACALALRGALVRRPGGAGDAGFALPHCIARRCRLPFPVIEYRAAASDDDSTVRTACPETESWARVRFTCAWYSVERVLRWPHAPPPPRGFPPHLLPAPADLAALQAACAVRASAAALLAVENATTHSAVDDALALLTGYARLVEWRGGAEAEYAALPWPRALARFLRARPASPGDAATLARVLRLLRAHLHACRALDVSAQTDNLRWLWEALRRRDGVMSLLEPSPDGAELASLRTDLVRLVRALRDVDAAVVGDSDRSDVQQLLLECLERVDFTDLREMGYACELAACLRDSSGGGDAWRRLAGLLTRAPLSEWAAGGGRRAAHALLRDLLLALACRTRPHTQSVPRELVEAALACATKGRVELRAAALLALADVVRTQPHTSVYTELVEAAARALCDGREASAARAAAAALLTNLTAHHVEGDTRVLTALEAHGFPDAAADILRTFYSARQPEGVGGEEVSGGAAVCVAELLHNLLTPQLCRRWSRHSLLSLLFRCMDTGDARVWRAACAALARAAAACARVRRALADQHDCVRLLLRALARRTDVDGGAGWRLAGEVAADREGAAVLWSLLLPAGDVDTCGAFFLRLSTAIRTACHDEREAALLCTERLSVALRQPELSSSRARWEDVPAPPGARAHEGASCEASYSVELLCDALLDHYDRHCVTAPTHHWGAEGCCERACGTLAALLAASARAQRRALHRALPHTLLRALHSLALPLHTQPEGEGEWRAPVWTLALAQSSMVRCAAAKESYAGGELAGALLRLWPRLAADDVPLDAALRLLATFTDDCERARADTTRCALGRCLLLETCAAAAREMSSRPHAARLCVALRVLAQCASHPHARALIFKSAVMSSLSRLHPALTRARCAPGEEARWRRAEAAWERVWCALARHADAPAAARLLEGRSTLCALAVQRGVMLRALALLAFRPQARLALLHSDEVLQTWARVLAGEGAAGAGQGALVACAAAVWALAANNHKAKQVLRECGVTASVASRLQRLQLSAASQPADRAALQLLTYTHSVLQLP